STSQIYTLSLHDALPIFRPRNNWRLRGPGIQVCDAEDRDRLGRLFDEHHFAAVLDCGGNCALKHCELDPRVAWTMNVEATRHLRSEEHTSELQSLRHLVC